MTPRTLPRSDLKLLIVDDDPNTRALLSDALEGRGACVRSSASASEAQRTIMVWHPDLVISDVGMPRESGYDLIRRVCDLPAEAGGRTPAIACTGYARAEDRARDERGLRRRWSSRSTSNCSSIRSRILFPHACGLAAALRPRGAK